MNKIIKQEKKDLEKIVGDITQIEVSPDTSIQRNNILTNILQFAQIERNLVKLINPETDYFVKIPNYIKKGLKSGEYNLLKKRETGELLASVMETNKDGKKIFLTNLTLAEGKVLDETYMQNISDSIFNLALQQQYRHITYHLEQICDTLKRIEKGQKYTWIGSIRGAMMQLQNAEKDALEDRKHDISNARQSLYSALCTIQEVLKDRIGIFKPIPSSKFMIYCKIIFSKSDYVKAREIEYDEIKLYIDNYILGYKLLAYADYLEGRMDKVPDDFIKCSNFLSGLDLSAIKTLENLYGNGKNRLSKEWFICPQGYVSMIEEHFCQKDYDAVEIQIKGKDLLEVLDYDKD